MKSTSKNGSRKSSRKRQSQAAKKKPVASSKVAQLERKVEALQRELAGAQSRENATGEILRVIANSPIDLQPVLNAVAESAARLCEAKDALIYRVKGNTLKQMAVYGSMPAGPPQPFNCGTATGRAILDRKTIHVHDMTAEVETESKRWTLLTALLLEVASLIRQPSTR